MAEPSFVASTLPVQRSFEELGTPLRDVTFCVVDLETTGGSPTNCMITEVGAVKLRGGECLGTYQTLVDPGCAIPPEITVITGITESMVTRAPRIESITPSLLEFIGDSVVVGHNVRFDLAFINATLEAQKRPRLPNRSIDTLALSRRLLRPEVSNCKLGTLASRFRLDHQPSHRALDDALATGDLLHLLIERSSAVGATGLDDLVALTTLAGGPQASKLRLTESLPRSPGVYMFRGRSGSVLYVGKASNLRSRVRSYFSSDQRRKVAQLLRETTRIDHRECVNSLDAAVQEIRLIHQHLPRFNKQGKTSGRYPYVKLTLQERFPRMSIVSGVKHDGGMYLGPISSRRIARLLIEAIEAAVPIRRCTARISAHPDRTECTASQLGVAMCPCAGSVSETSYRRSVDQVVVGLSDDPESLLAPLRIKIDSLAQAERYEEAADVRDRAAALSGAIGRQRIFSLLYSAGEITFTADDCRMQVKRGRLVSVGGSDLRPLKLPEPEGLAAAPSGPPNRDEADEMLCVGRWMAANASKLTLESVSGVLAEPVQRPASFVPTGKSVARRVVSRRPPTLRA